MRFDEFQEKAAKYDSFKQPKKVNIGDGAFIEKALGLAGEAGEVVDKLKKIIRDKGGEVSDYDRGEVAKELGDTLWYVAMIARYLGLSLSEVAQGNIEKLESRYQRGKLGGSGDNR